MPACTITTRLDDPASTSVGSAKNAKGRAVAGPPLPPGHGSPLHYYVPGLVCLPGWHDTPDHRDRPPARGRRVATAGGPKAPTAELAIRRTTQASAARAGRWSHLVTAKAEDSLRAGAAELERGAWEPARAAFEAAVALEGSPEAWEGLSWAAWWLEDGAAAIDAREHAYRRFRQAGDRHGAARMALWLFNDQVEFRRAYAVAGGWLERAARILDELEPGARARLAGRDAGLRRAQQRSGGRPGARRQRARVRAALRAGVAGDARARDRGPRARRRRRRRRGDAPPRRGRHGRARGGVRGPLVRGVDLLLPDLGVRERARLRPRRAVVRAGRAVRRAHADPVPARRLPGAPRRRADVARPAGGGGRGADRRGPES